MRPTPLAVLLLAALLFSGYAATAPRPPVSTPLKLETSVGTLIATPTACDDLAPLVEKWQVLFALRDWTIQVACVPIPAKEGALALSFTNPYRRTVAIAVDPVATDDELMVIHELAHVLFNVTCEAKSEVIEEQIIVTLSELLRRLEKVQNVGR